MRGKKWLVFITGLLTVLSIIVVLVISKNQCSKVYDISLAIFGSSILGLIMSLIEYFFEKRLAMEKFISSSTVYIDAFLKIKPLCFDQPLDLILRNMNEFQSDERRIARNELKKWLKENGKDDSEKNCDHVIETAKNSFCQYINNLEKILEISFNELDFSYGNLDFIFNKNVRNDLAYKDIYLRIKDMIDLLKRYQIHFDYLKSGEGSFSYCCKLIVDINNKLFVMKKDSVKNLHKILDAIKR